MSTEKISGEFVPTTIWKTKRAHYTNKTLAEFMALRDGDSDPGSGGYPVGPIERNSDFYRRSDGRVFEIREIRVDDARARDLFTDDLARLNAIKASIGT